MSARDTESESASARGYSLAATVSGAYSTLQLVAQWTMEILNRLLVRSQTARPLRRHRGEGMISKPATSPSRGTVSNRPPVRPFDKQRLKPATCAANQAQTGSHCSPAQSSSCANCVLSCAPSARAPCALGLGSAPAWVHGARALALALSHVGGA